MQLQVEGEINQNLNVKAISAQNLSARDFPAFAEGHSGVPKYSVEESQQSVNPYRASDKENLLFFKSSSSIPSRGPIDFASTVRKMASQDTGMWNYDRNGSADVNIGSSRSSHVLASAYNGAQERAIHGDRLQGRSLARAAPVWLETGDSVGNILVARTLLLLTYACGRIRSCTCLTLLRMQQICIRKHGRKLVTMLVCVSCTLNRCV